MPQFERRYIADYCAERFPEGGYQLNYPLGPIPRGVGEEVDYAVAARFYRPLRPSVDAVKFYDDRLVVLETKVHKAWHVLGQLLLYGHLVQYTEELRPWWGKPVELRIIMPEISPLVREICQSVGIYPERYVTDYIAEQQAHYDRYWTKEYQTHIQERNAIRRALNVE